MDENEKTKLMNDLHKSSEEMKELNSKQIKELAKDNKLLKKDEKKMDEVKQETETTEQTYTRLMKEGKVSEKQ